MFLGTLAVDDGRVLLGDGHLLCAAQHIKGSLFELQALLFADDHATRQHGDVLEHGLAAVAEARSLHGANLELRTQAVHHERSESFAVNVLGDDQQGTSALHGGFEDRQEVLDVGDLLVVNQDVGVLHHALHLFGVGHEVSREIATVKLHTLHGLQHRVATLGIFDGDDTVHAHGAHTVGDELTDFSVVVGGDGSHLFNLVVAFAHLFALFADAFHHFGHGLVNAAFHVERVGTSCHVLHAFGQDGLSQHGGSGRTIAGIVAGFRCHALHQLCAGVLESVIQFDFLGHAHTVLGDAGCAELLVDHHVAAFRAEGYFHCVGQCVSTFAQTLAGVYIIYDFFCHGFVVVLCGASGLASGPGLRLLF